MFAMKADIAMDFLKSLSNIIDGKTKRQNMSTNMSMMIELPTVEPLGLMAHQNEEERDPSIPEYSYILYRDGLALLRPESPI